jgi:AcrR family transcriptional regulator
MTSEVKSHRIKTKNSSQKESDQADTGRLSEIYRAAAKIICEKGYDAASMNDIADAVGLTKAGIYHHISGKRDLLFRVMNFGLDELEEEVIEPARQITDPEERLRAIITKHVQLIARHSTPEGNNPVTIVIEEVAGLTPAHRRKINQRKRAYVDFIRDTLESLAGEGKLNNVDVTAAGFSLVGMIEWLSRWYNPRGRLKPEDLSEEVTKIAFGGLLKQRPG